MVNNDISASAMAYIKKNRRLLCHDYACTDIYLPTLPPSTYLMAGSPGAGKTEYSKSFIKLLEEKEPLRKIVRIDADEIRSFLPQYNKTNASEVQSAAFKGVEILVDHVLQQGQDCVIDGTLANYEKSCSNIARSLSKKREVGILYIYQDPLIAWDFTKKREAIEGRDIPKEMFIKSFFAAKENVNKIKLQFGKEVQIWLITKDYKQGVENTYFNIDNIDKYLKIAYTPDSLAAQLKNL